VLSSNQPGSFEVEHHLVNRRRADAEVSLHVGFGGRPSEHTRVSVDEAKYCPCLGVKLSAVGRGDIGEDFG